MKNLPFDTVNLLADDVEALESTYKALKAKFNIGLPDANAQINKFELFNNEQEASVSGTFLFNYPETDHYLSFIKIHYQFTSGRTNLNYFKCQAWAFVTLKKDFGRVLIRKETFTDRVLEMVHHTELKFNDDQAFNKNFYVCTNDEEKARLSMTADFRAAVMTIKDTNFVIEIIKDTLVIRNNQPVNPEETVYLAEVVSQFAALK